MRQELREQQMPWGFSQFDFKVLNISQENCGSRWYLGAVEGLLAKCAGLGNGSRFLFSSCNCREQPWWILATFQHMTGGQTPQKWGVVNSTDCFIFISVQCESSAVGKHKPRGQFSHSLHVFRLRRVSKNLRGILSFNDEFIFDFLKLILLESFEVRTENRVYFQYCEKVAV